jgi:prepilin-type N-terminal cleavage/methylation domain-containing protein
MKISTFSKKMRGLTLIEVLLALGIAAVVIVGAVAFYNNASNTTKMNEAKAQIQTIGGGIKTLYAGIAPQNAIDGNQLINPWGGATIVSGAARTFEIRMEEVPNDACVNILSSGILNEGNIISMRVGATTFTNDADPALAVTSCNAGSNAVRFTIR